MLQEKKLDYAIVAKSIFPHFQGRHPKKTVQTRFSSKESNTVFNKIKIKKNT